MCLLKDKVLQKRAEGILRTCLNPLLFIQTLQGSAGLVKFQTSSSNLRYLHAVYSTAVIVYFLIYFIVVGIPQFFEDQIMSMAIIGTIQRVLAMLGIIIIIIESFHGSSFKTVLNAILHVNSVVQSIERFERNIIVFSAICTVIQICDLGLSQFVVYYFIDEPRVWWNYSFTILTLCVVQCEVFICVILVRTIAIQFDQMSKELHTTVAVSSKHFKPVYLLDYISGSVSCSKLKRIYKTYSMIVQAVERIQEFYANKIFIYINVTFLYQMQNLEMFILTDKNRDNDQVTSWQTISIDVYNFVRYLIPISMLCFYCESIYSYVDSIKDSLVHIIIHNDNRQIQRLCCLMLDVIRLQPLEMVLLRLYRVDLRLVIRYLAFLATYIFVVLQLFY